MVTHDRASQLLSYDPVTGMFYWRITNSNRAKAGSVAGGTVVTPDGKSYWRIRVDGREYKAHRLAWLIVYGDFPPVEIDHVDGNGLNNRITNLRAVTSSDNSRNRRRSSNNTTGVTGVRWRSDCSRWRAVIQVNYKTISLGHYVTKDDAISARKAAEEKYGFHVNHGSDRPL